MSQNRCRLYLVTPPEIDSVAFREKLKAALDGGDVACLQIRLKDCADEAVLRAAETLAPVCHEHDVVLLINDRPDLAAACDADGVHIGQEDASYESTRDMLRTDKVVGVTCHNSRHLAIAAAEGGADYVAFGSFFETQTKSPKTRATLDVLKWWRDLMLVPCVAIGGITPENCPPLVRAGADFLAVVSAVWDHANGPAAGVTAFNRAIAEAIAENGSDAHR